MKLLGSRIQHYRKQQNLSRKQVAEKIGISISYVSNYENGYTRLVDIKMLFKFADALNVTLDDLLIDSLECYDRCGKLKLITTFIVDFNENQMEMYADIVKAYLLKIENDN